jgi:hypothetical protein
VIFAVPAEMPVIVANEPAALIPTVASPELQVPPASASVSAIALPEQTTDGPPIADGIGLMVIVFVDAQPLAVNV